MDLPPDRRRVGLRQERRPGGARGLRLSRDQQPAAGDARGHGRQPRKERAGARGDRARRQDRPGVAGLSQAIAAVRALGWTVRFLLPRREDGHAGQAVLGDASPSSILERRAHAHRSDRPRARAAGADARGGLRVRHERPARGGAARLDQGLRRGGPVQAHAPLRVVRLQARRAARRGSRVRRALPAQSALRGGACAAHGTRPAGDRVPRASVPKSSACTATSITSSRAGCPITHATIATTSPLRSAARAAATARCSSSSAWRKRSVQRYQVLVRHREL